MRPLFVLCTLSVLLLLASTIDARKNLEEYWRIVMKGQPMPESVQDLLAVDRAASTTDENADQKSNPLILSYNVQPSEVESLAKNFNPRPNIFLYGFHNSHNDQPSEVKSFDKDLLKPDNKVDANA
ncbi:hypothetical protein WN944_029020 [Citrus x changshan-huyou]|uniref:Organ-specific protein S2 n=2 Tax=Citrus TaxID=2706 RepID=A0A2H5QLX5_CITUN|nr:hypothetical protein CUMW_239720 [Citrus unshiu]